MGNRFQRERKLTEIMTNSGKAGMRKAVRKMRDEMTDADVKRKSAKIAERLEKIEEYRDAASILFYASKGKEVMTGDLVKQALGEGRNVLLPITNTSSGELEVSEIGELKAGPYGIPEPRYKKTCPEKMVGAVIVPGIVFDRQGYRLGYGLGYYDKLLARLTATKIGLAYDFQVVDCVPREKHDQPVDLVVTETETIRVN